MKYIALLFMILFSTVIFCFAKETNRNKQEVDYVNPLIGTPFAGFRGALNFARELDAGVYTPAWKFVTPPWKKEPLLEGSFPEAIEKKERGEKVC